MLNNVTLCRQNESTGESKKRKDSCAQHLRDTRKSLKHPGLEINEEWETRLDEQMMQQEKYRNSLSDKEKQRFKEKDTARRRELRAAKTRLMTIREQEYLDPPYDSLYMKTRRLCPVACAGSFIEYLMNRLKENLKEKK